MGSSTGNMLVDDPKALEFLFAHVPTILLTHCESSPIVTANEALYRAQYGENVPAHLHPMIRDEACCYASSKMAVELAKISDAIACTAPDHSQRVITFENKPLHEKHITAEVCIHHLHFDAQDYDQLGHLIKCNPSIKTKLIEMP